MAQLQVQIFNSAADIHPIGSTQTPNTLWLFRRDAQTFEIYMTDGNGLFLKHQDIAGAYADKATALTSIPSGRRYEGQIVSFYDPDNGLQFYAFKGGILDENLEPLFFLPNFTKSSVTWADSTFGDDATGKIFSAEFKFKTIGAAEQAMIDNNGNSGTIYAVGDFVEPSSNFGFDGNTVVFGNVEMTGGIMRTNSNYNLSISGTLKPTTAPTDFGNFKDLKISYKTLDVSAVINDIHNGSQLNIGVNTVTTNFPENENGTRFHPDGEGRTLELNGSVVDTQSNKFLSRRMWFLRLADTRVVMKGDFLRTKDYLLQHNGPEDYKETSSTVFDFNHWVSKTNMKDENYQGTLDDWGILSQGTGVIMNISNLDLEVGAGQYVALLNGHVDFVLQNSKIKVTCMSDLHNCGFIQSSIYTNSDSPEIIKDSLIKLIPKTNNNKFHWYRDINAKVIYENCTIVIEQDSGLVPYMMDFASDGDITLRNCKIYIENGTSVIGANGNTVNVEVENCYSNVPLFEEGQDVIDTWNQQSFHVNPNMKKPLF